MFGSYGRIADNGHGVPLVGLYLSFTQSLVLYIYVAYAEYVKCTPLCPVPLHSVTRLFTLSASYNSAISS